MQLYDIPEYSLDELYDYYNRTIDLAASYDWAVHPRTQFHVQSALRDYRKFADGELDIDLGTKRWFRVMSHLVEEVGLGEPENDTGDDLGGRRSSGKDETEATGHGEARGVVR